MTSLFQERCQIQVRKDAKIASAPDLKGMRVGVGVAGFAFINFLQNRRVAARVAVAA